MKGDFNRLSGFVLAGGASRRMGQDKALLRLGGTTMLARQIHLVRRLTPRVAVLGSANDYAQPGVPVYPDEMAGGGPLAGIYTGLRRTRTEYNVFLGCDLPDLHERFLRWLCHAAFTAGADVTVPESLEHAFHPLCAVYRRRVRRVVRWALERGSHKVSSFFGDVNCRVLRMAEIRRAGFSPAIFGNINTLEDYEAARRRLEGAPRTAVSSQ